MLTKEEVEAKYKQLHDELTASYYGGVSELTKEQFDQQHARIWLDLESELEQFKTTDQIAEEQEQKAMAKAEEMIDSISNLAEAKVFLKKLCKRLFKNRDLP